MFTIPVYVAILTGKRITDVVTLHETKGQAIGQCRRWPAKVTNLDEDLEHPGYEYFAQYGTQDDTVRAEKHQLELQDSPEDDTRTIYAPGPVLHALIQEACQEEPDGHS